MTKDWSEPPHTSLARERVAGFTGFFEGRSGVTPPEWWVRALERETRSPAGDPSVIDPLNSATALTIPGWNASLGRRDYYAGPVPTTIRTSAGRIAIVQEGRQVEISAERFKSLLPFPGSRASDITVFYPVLHDEGCFVLSYLANVPGSLRVTRLRNSDGRIQWQQDGWGHGFRTYVGQASQFATLQVDDADVTVFGEGTFGTYAEGFDLRSGRVKFRFCTTGHSSAPRS